MKRILLLSFLMLFSLIAQAIANESDFYGLKFGNTRDEVNKIFRIDDDNNMFKAQSPGHNIDELYFKFDNKDRLYYINAYYKLTNDSELNKALLHAVDEKLVQLIKQNNDITVETDTSTVVKKFGTIKYISLRLVSKRLIDEYVTCLTGDFVQKME